MDLGALAEPQPPPPPPPPAPADLEEVYRPFEDPALTGQVSQESSHQEAH
eukprot:CAMPEP_0115138796 /NCGR_PEP_ID=MMETSP0227-20121206/57882_1 /TAXON_ID=89957 /ORGANISM="Polarella glacialis, Strain CCMP 1383" /LENGTH=49 /DNA_ID= /DNA_START= /DNA_END= /DNA_ORIENTATION=